MSTTQSPKRESAPGVVQRLEQFFQVANLRCAECGEWHGDPKSLGIQTEAEWHQRMTRDMLWCGVNAAAVLEALPLLEEEWAESCAVMRNVLRSLA